MDVFSIGITGGVGGLLARELASRGDTVRGLVRREPQRADLSARGIDTVVGDLTTITVDALAVAIGGADAVVYSAGSNGGTPQATKAIDEDGFATAIEATRRAGVHRLVSVSVIPEGWRERVLGDDVEYYFAAKKKADVAATLAELLHEPRISRQILELNGGSTPIVEAVRRCAVSACGDLRSQSTTQTRSSPDDEMEPPWQ